MKEKMAIEAYCNNCKSHQEVFKITEVNDYYGEEYIGEVATTFECEKCNSIISFVTEKRA